MIPKKPTVHHTLTLPCPQYYNLHITCNAHGWKELTPFVWNEESGTLGATVSVNNGAVDVIIEQQNPNIIIHTYSHKELNESHLNEIQSLVKRILDLEVNTDKLHETAVKNGLEYSSLIENGAGRILHSATLWEDAAKTLFTTNCSWALTKKISNAICAAFSTSSSPLGNYYFPSPEIVAESNESELRNLVPIGYRAPYLLSLAREFSDNLVLIKLEDKVLSFKEAKNIVMNLKGFGDYAATHVLVMAGYYDEIPVDSVVTSYLKNAYGDNLPTPLLIENVYGKWGNFKWWGMKLDKIHRRNSSLEDF